MVGIVSWGSYIPKYRIKVEEIAKVKGISLSLAEGVYQALQLSDKA